MAVVIDELVTRFVLQDKYTPVASKVTTSTAAMAGSMGTLSAAAGPAGIAIAAVGVAALGVAAAAVAAANVTKNLYIQFGTLSLKALQARAEIESLELSLQAVAGAGESGRLFKELREIAKLPGLGIEEAVRGFVKLRAAGLGEGLAQRSLLSMGNALASVGAGKAELEGVILALTQIASKGVISAEEINQIAERLPQVRVAMQQAFGTANTEAIQKMGLSAEAFIAGLVLQLEKLPRVAGGLKNTFENLADFQKEAWGQAGKALESRFGRPLQKLGDFAAYLVDRNVFGELADSISRIFVRGDVTDNAFVELTASLVAGAQTFVDLVRIGVDYAIAKFDDMVRTMTIFAPQIRLAYEIAKHFSNQVAQTPEWQSIAALFEMRKNRLVQGFEQSQNGGGGLDGLLNKALEYVSGMKSDTAKIAENTAALVMDFQQYALGGGDLGRIGVEPVRMGGRNRKLNQAVSLIEQALSDTSWGVAKANARMARA